ncbi:MAG: peptidoglycan DD-metalloendopeptidase family protein [Eubacterium sp.]|nr:peptidoglycan DD-metalloendopeptidase family protein [Eubacterium sp.]
MLIGIHNFLFMETCGKNRNMKKHGIKKVISSIMVAAMLATSCNCFYPDNSKVVFADELSDAKAKKDEATQKKKDAEQKLASLKKDKEDTLEIIAELDREICDYEEKIKVLNEKMNALRAKEAVNETNLQNAYIAESRQYEDMKERIQFAYENGDASYIQAVVSIKDYSNVMNQSEYVSNVSSYDQKELNELIVIEEQIGECKVAIQENMDEIEDLTVQAEGEQQALQVMQDGKQQALSDFNNQISETEYSIEQLEAIEAEQEAAIANILAEAAARRAAAEAAAKAAAQQQAQQAANASPGNAQQAPVNYTPMNSYSGGAFRWPMPSSGSISCGFGPRVAPTAGASTYHKGIDIGCASGAPIVAAADGVVSFTGYFGGGGNTVIIDHGNGISTLYMHMSGFAVGPGANVTAGTTIGYAGSTGVSTGPHLHFAVTVGGSYVDPMGYL